MGGEEMPPIEHYIYSEEERSYDQIIPRKPIIIGRPVFLGEDRKRIDSEMEDTKIQELEKEKEAFEKKKNYLLQHGYRGKYVAIHNGTVVDSDDNEINLIRRFFQEFGDVSVYIDRVSEKDELEIRLVTPFL